MASASSLVTDLLPFMYCVEKGRTTPARPIGPIAAAALATPTAAATPASATTIRTLFPMPAPSRSPVTVAVRVLDVETAHGLARAHVHRTGESRGALVLGHGAGGGVAAPDLAAVARAAVANGIDVALVEQPYRVAGRRSPAPAARLDAAWLEVVERPQAAELAGAPPLRRGRPAGAGG